jgi:3-oxoacyl-[acyl-carrier-protein] synthase III
MTAKQISEATNGIWSEQAVSKNLGIRSDCCSRRSDDGTQEMGAKAGLDALKNTGC